MPEQPYEPILQASLSRDPRPSDHRRLLFCFIANIHVFSGICPLSIANVLNLSLSLPVDRTQFPILLVTFLFLPSAR